MITKCTGDLATNLLRPFYRPCETYPQDPCAAGVGKGASSLDVPFPNPAESNGSSTKISDQNKKVPALCFDDFLTTGDLDKLDLSIAETKALGNIRKQESLNPVGLGRKRKS